ncbi:MAG: hypothetical protein Q8L98_07360 [Chlamydiales bacterium]|nr:hypothetical protein [Chlamydiales bacterium]
MYIGQTLNDKPHGQGILIKKNECYHEGAFENGRPCDQGININVKNRVSYKGGYNNARGHGHGIIIKQRKQHYEGMFENSYYHGPGICFNLDGSATKGIFSYNHKISGHISEMGHTDFIGPLFSLSFGASSMGSVLGSLIDLLTQHDEYRPYANALSQVHQRLLVSPQNYEQEAEEIHSQLTKDRKPQLLEYGMLGHSMMLYLAPDLDGEFIFCEIFNSGKGLEYHESKDGKFQTMLQVKAGKEKITKDTIQSFLNWSKFKHIEETYQAVLNLGEKQEQTPGEEICQAQQKASNCFLECLFAFLRNKMSAQDYHKLRWLVFKTCIEEAKKSEEPETQKFLERHWKEINAKLKKKYEKHCATDPSINKNDEMLKSCQISEEEHDLLLEKIQFAGFQVVHYANGSCYRGQIRNGKAWGVGELSCANGDFFEGQFVVGQLHGFGRVSYAKGFSYEGELILGKPHGFGVLIDPNGDQYEGQFILGRASGYGTLTYTNGDCFVGTFVMGKPNIGKFTASSPERNSYTGRFHPRKSQSPKDSPAQLLQKSPISRKRKADW